MENFSIPALAWILLTMACVVIILAGLKTALRKTGWQNQLQQKIFTGTIAVLSFWIALLLVFSYNGFFKVNGLPPRPALAMLVPLPVVMLIAFSNKGTVLLQSVPSHWLIGMQSFRIAVELLLFVAFVNDKLPVQMTFEGRNFDVITGLSALPTGYLIARNKPYAGKLAIAFNILGVLLLLNILIVAVLSMPTPIRYFMNEPANTLVGQFPFILLPGVLVPLAYSLHIFSLRQLLLRKKSELTAQHLIRIN